MERCCAHASGTASPLPVVQPTVGPLEQYVHWSCKGPVGLVAALATAIQGARQAKRKPPIYFAENHTFKPYGRTKVENITLSEEDTNVIIAKSKEMKVTVNSYLLAAGIMTIRDLRALNKDGKVSLRSA